MPTCYPDGQRVQDVLYKTILKHPGMTGSELQEQMRQDGVWLDHLESSKSFGRRIVNLIEKGLVARGKKRKCRAPLRAGKTRRRTVLTYWPMHLSNGYDGTIVESSAYFSGEFKECIESLKTLMDRPYTQVPMNVIRQKVQWLYEIVLSSDPVLPRERKKCPPGRKGG